MNDWGNFSCKRTKEERAHHRRRAVKSLVAAGYSRAVAITKAKSMVR